MSLRRAHDAPVNSVARVLLLAGVLACFSAPTASAENWPCWRGPRRDGTSLGTAPPTHWSATENVTWKTALPGVGHSSPIVWGDHLFLTTALEDRQERVLLSLDRKTGAVLWQSVVLKAPLEAKNNENSYASATPATDGRKVFVSFLDGMEVVVAAYDLEGHSLWTSRPGRFKSQWGFSHSPVLFEDKILLVCYSKGENFVVSLKQSDGSTAWKVAAVNPTQSYSQPLLLDIAGRGQMIVPGNKGLTSYDPTSGKVFWSVGGLADDSVVTPVYNSKANLVLTCTSWPSKVLVAVKPDGEGDVTAGKVAWRSTEGAPYVPSPVSVGDWFFTSSYAGRSAFCLDAVTGQVLWKESMGLHHASPVVANGLVYFLNDDGVAHVIRAGARYELVSRNELGESTYASPAVSDGQLFLRGFKHLYCIGKGP